MDGRASSTNRDPDAGREDKWAFEEHQHIKAHILHSVVSLTCHWSKPSLGNIIMILLIGA
jgi:hypothetical protein